MTDADLARRVDLDLLISSLRGEARIADRPGQYDRLNAAADVVVDAVEYIQRLTAERDALAAQLDALRAGIEGLADEYVDAIPGFVRRLRAAVADAPAAEPEQAPERLCADCGHVEGVHACTFAAIRCAMCGCTAFRPAADDEGGQER